MPGAGPPASGQRPSRRRTLRPAFRRLLARERWFQADSRPAPAATGHGRVARVWNAPRACRHSSSASARCAAHPSWRRRSSPSRSVSGPRRRCSAWCARWCWRRRPSRGLAGGEARRPDQSERRAGRRGL